MSPETSKMRLDAADKLKNNSSSWIGSADAKATTIASVASVVLGIVAAFGPTPHAHTANMCYTFFAIASTATIFSCLGVILPRTRRSAYIGPNGLRTSPSYFGDVPDTFAAYCQLDIATEVEDADRLEQAYIAARIAKEKMFFVQLTTWCFVVTLLLLVATMLFKFDGLSQAEEPCTCACN